MESILTSIKKLLGITEDDESFDSDITTNINSVFLNLKQIGIGPSKGFVIKDKTTTWSEFIPNSIIAEAAKSYTYLNVKLKFDSASLTSAHIDAIKQQIKELEWRLRLEAETE